MDFSKQSVLHRGKRIQMRKATKDDLDFTVRFQLLRNDSFLAKLVRPVTFPFTKLLLEFKVTGSVDEPQWQYISVIDRIL